MISLRNFAKLVASLIFVVSLSSLAHGQPAAAFVSSGGSDLNTPCARATPCRNLQAAVDAVAAKGQVTILDSAGYGAVTIAKSVIINAYPGVVAAINSTSGTAISITAGNVIISGLKINGNGTATTGISVVGTQVVVENCDITGFGFGVSVGNNSAISKLDLINSNLYYNGTAVFSNGQGANFPGNMTVASVSMVRINGGNITQNVAGVEMRSPGAANLANVALFTGGANTGNVNLIGNVFNVVCTVTPMCNPQPITYAFNSGYTNSGP